MSTMAMQRAIPTMMRPVRYVRQVGKQQPGQGEHDRWTDDPVQNERRHHEPTVGGDPAQLAVADLRQHRVHHHEQAHGDRQARAGQGRARKPGVEVREEPAEHDAQGHRRANPHRQEPVEQGELADDRALWLKSL